MCHVCIWFDNLQSGGLSVGLLNVAIVIPQDAWFGGGNLPAFVLGAVAAALSAILAVAVLPNPKPAEEAKASTLSLGSFH
ncbi:hypothetical protein VNO78_33113 [Psophocarpus tetragonolobus]|uniref:Uncharacterized protein n=1 Tax=Psophocarpus tetragonolobus TaxID=3891 RepID=A0AAN9RS71_PSOTE